MVVRSGVGVFVAVDGTPTLFDHEGVAQVTGEEAKRG